MVNFCKCPKIFILAMLLCIIGIIIIGQHMTDLDSLKIQNKIIETPEFPNLLRNLLQPNKKQQPYGRDRTESDEKSTKSSTQTSRQIQDRNVNQMKMAISLVAMRTTTKSTSEMRMVTTKSTISNHLNHSNTEEVVKTAEYNKDLKAPERTVVGNKENTSRSKTEEFNNVKEKQKTISASTDFEKDKEHIGKQSIKNNDTGKQDSRNIDPEKEDFKRIETEKENPKVVAEVQNVAQNDDKEKQDNKSIDKERDVKHTEVVNKSFKHIDEGQHVIENNDSRKQDIKSKDIKENDIKTIDREKEKNKSTVNESGDIKNTDSGKIQAAEKDTPKSSEDDMIIKSESIESVKKDTQSAEKANSLSVNTTKEQNTEKTSANQSKSVEHTDKIGLKKINVESVYVTPKPTTVPTTTTISPPTTTTTQPPYRVQSLKELTRPSIIRYNYNKHWQMQTDYFEIYLYRAYYDDRITLKTNPAVRVIGISECAENRTLHCLLWFKGQEHPEMVNVTLGRIGNGVPRHGLLFREYIFSCPLPDTPNGQFQPPEHVSLITAEYMLPTNILPVLIPEKPAKKLEFGMCVSITYWKQDPHRLVEWLELLKLWGVEEVTVYNQSLAAESDAVFRYYQQKGFVDYRSGEKPMIDGGEYTFFLMMTPVINDCMYRNIHRYKKLVITDFDELIVPRGPTMNNYADMLQQIDIEQPRFCKYKSYWFRNVYFFYNFPPISETPRYLTTSRFLTRIRHSTYGNSIKSINDPMTCIRVHNHFCWEAIEGYDKQEWYVDVKTHLGMNQHYKKCHLDGLHGDDSKGECKKAMKTTYYDDTMLRFKNKIEPHVIKACKELNLPL